MKAILIDPYTCSLEEVELEEGNTPANLEQLHLAVGEDCLDFCRVMPGEMVAVGDHSALHDPPLPSYLIGKYRLHGCGVLMGYTRFGASRDTRLSVDELSLLIEFE